MKLQKLAGATSEIWQVFVRDSSSTTGGGLTGLVYNTASLTAYYHRDTDTTATAITLATMTVGTFTSSGFKEIDATNMPGWYQFCPPNTALASGAKSCAFHLKGATNMAPLPIEAQLTAVNPDSATAFITSVATVTTVTNQLTAAAIATGVWQDSTAGDFTTASSIGKALYIANVAPGASGGHMISGSNSGTTTLGALTVTGNFSINGTNDVAQTGDSYARIGATGSGLSSIAPASTALSTATWSGTRAGYLDNLSAGAVALASGVTVTTNNDKTGYSLSQTFPTNFSALAITAGGAVTAGTVSDKTGYSLASTYDFAKGTVAMTESYAVDGATMTPAQAMHMVWAFLAEKNVSGTTLTAKKLDGSTSAMTFTLDSATAPTSITRAT